jgi:hypothetical protein
MKFIFVADSFLDNGVYGGGELNNNELMNLINEKDHEVLKINSHMLSPEDVVNNKECAWIICNFINLRPDTMRAFISDVEEARYVIYEHDHKYLKTRNPSVYDNFLAPEEDIINKEFYSNALAVFCQSDKHAEVARKNLKLDNIESVSGNLWSEKILDLISDLAKNNKNNSCSVMASPIPHKNTKAAILYCKAKQLDYTIIDPCKYDEFMTRLSKNDTFVFFPQTLETLCRVVVEARMLGCKIITNKNVSATEEDWFALKGEELISKVKTMRQKIPDMVISKFV